MRQSLLTVVVFFVLALVGVEVMAQCPMCRIAAESNLENGGTAGKGLNQGILYMLLMPYIIIFGIGYIWWKNRKKDHHIHEPIKTTSVKAELGEAYG